MSGKLPNFRNNEIRIRRASKRQRDLWKTAAIAVRRKLNLAYNDYSFYGGGV